MDHIFFWIVLEVMGVTGFFWGFKMLRLKRLIENIPTSKIRSVAMGLTEVKGEVTRSLQDYLKSPFTNVDCIHFHYKIEEYRRSGKRKRWVTVSSGSKSVPFFVKDETGEMIVHPKGAKFDIPIDNKFGFSRNETPPHLNVDDNISIKSFFGFSKRLRFSESFVEPGNNVYVLGSAKNSEFKDTIDSNLSHTQIMIAKGENEKVFYISDHSEKGIVRKKTWQSALGILGGGALALFALAGILGSFSLFGLAALF